MLTEFDKEHGFLLKPVLKKAYSERKTRDKTSIEFRLAFHREAVPMVCLYSGRRLRMIRPGTSGGGRRVPKRALMHIENDV